MTIDAIAASLRRRVSEIDEALATFTALREERDRLTAAIAALEHDADPSVREPSRPGKRPRQAARAKRTTRPRGQTQSAVLTFLAAHPGSSASAIADALGLKRNSTSTRLTQMAKVGLIVKSAGRGYELPPAAVESSSGAPADQPS